MSRYSWTSTISTRHPLMSSKFQRIWKLSFYAQHLLGRITQIFMDKVFQSLMTKCWTVWFLGYRKYKVFKFSSLLNKLGGKNPKQNICFVTDGNFLPRTSTRAKSYFSSKDVHPKTANHLRHPMPQAALPAPQFSDKSGLLSQNQVSTEFEKIIRKICLLFHHNFFYSCTASSA